MDSFSNTSQANDDIGQILISTDKIGKRGRGIGALDLAPETPARANGAAASGAPSTSPENGARTASPFAGSPDGL